MFFYDWSFFRNDWKNKNTLHLKTLVPSFTQFSVYLFIILSIFHNLLTKICDNLRYNTYYNYTYWILRVFSWTWASFYILLETSMVILPVHAYKFMVRIIDCERSRTIRKNHKPSHFAWNFFTCLKLQFESLKVHFWIEA